MLTDIDEYPHRPPEPLPARWQENFFVIARANDSDTCFFVHCKRWPASGGLVARVAAAADGRVVSTVVRESIPSDEFRVGGLALSVQQPYRSLRLSGSFRGELGFGPLGFIALGNGGPTGVEVDLNLRSALPPADFETGFAMLAAAARADAGTDGSEPLFEATQQHYEQGGTCTGTLTIDGTRHELDGLFVRDHTWGTRDESSMSAVGHGFWTATALNDGELFFNATGMVTPAGTRGIGVVVDADGQHTTDDIAVTFAPEPALYGFDRTSVRIGGGRPLEVTGSGRLHLVKYLPGSGPGRFDDNLIAEVVGDGVVGFGVHEYAGTLTPGQEAVLDGYDAAHHSAQQHPTAARSGATTERAH